MASRKSPSKYLEEQLIALREEEERQRAQEVLRLSEKTPEEITTELRKEVLEVLVVRKQQIRKQVAGMVDSYVKGSVLACLGIRQDSFNRYELDRTNGRTSLIADAIDQQVRESLKELVPKVLGSLISGFESSEEYEEIRKLVQKNFLDSLRYKVQQDAREEAESYVSELVKKMTREIMPDLGPEKS